MQQLKLIKGSIPKSILGSYIKNGPGLLTIGDEILPHWFLGNSGLLKVEFHDGKVYGKYKFVETPAYKKDIQQKSFSRSHIIF
jgi:all-trans-8'-apo-beta-carotenal 15,15'-oxygenase